MRREPYSSRRERWRFAAPVPDSIHLPVRLLFVSHSLPPVDRPLANVGGMQRVAAELHDALRQAPGVELHSILLRASWRWTHLRMVPFTARLLREIPRKVRHGRIDAVLFSSMVTAALALPVTTRLRERGVITAAIPVGRDVTLPIRPYQRLVPRVFRSLDLVFPISRATADECRRRGARETQLRVVPCGVDVGRFPARAARSRSRSEILRMTASDAHPLPADAHVLFSVGRHVERKGFDWFVEHVMPRLPPDVHFLLAGEGPSTPAIRAAVARTGLASRVRLLGRVNEGELSALFGGSDLFVMPNVPVPGDIEGFGVVMLEAGASGLPVVAAALEGILDVVRDGVNGKLVPSGDADAFARTIGELLSDTAARDSLAARSVAHTEETFGWPAIVQEHLHHLRVATADRPRAPRPPRSSSSNGTR